LDRLSRPIALLAALALAVAACSGAATPVPPSAAPAASPPPLPAAAQTWCLAHRTDVAADDQRAGDMGTVNRIHAGASPLADGSSRWAGLSPDQLRADPAFVLACLAAWAASSAAPG